MSQTAEQGIGRIFVAEQLMPLVIFEIGCNKSRVATVALFHGFKEDVGLWGGDLENTGVRPQGRQYHAL